MGAYAQSRSELFFFNKQGDQAMGKNYRFDNEIEAIWEVIKDFERGEVLSYELIKEHTRLESRDEPGWDRVVRKLRDALKQKRSIELGRAKANVGYPLLTADESFDLHLRRKKRGARAERSHAEMLALLPKDQLTGGRAAAVGVELEGAMRLLAMHDQQRQNTRAALKQSQALPRGAV